jgi:hypothetical protein
MIRRLFLFTAAAGAAARAQDTGFTGTPLVRLDADAGEAKRTELSDAAGQRYECRITRKGRGYVWASRGNRELVRADAGDWTYYVSPEGSGYVKVFKSGSAPGDYDYLEHLSTELKTITYWGKRAAG